MVLATWCFRPEQVVICFCEKRLPRLSLYENRIEFDRWEWPYSSFMTKVTTHVAWLSEKEWRQLLPQKRNPTRVSLNDCYRLTKSPRENSVLLSWCTESGQHRCHSSILPFTKSSVSNSSRPWHQGQARVETEPLPNWRCWLSIYPSCQFGYSSMDISQPIWIGRVVSRSPSGSICRFI